MNEGAHRRQSAMAMAGPIEQALLEVRDKLYPRAVTGKRATWRWLFVVLTQLVYFGTPWLDWQERQAVLFDLASRKIYLLGLVFWPQDVLYLAILLVILAYSLFFFTAVAGRLWCGYACPQSVYTELFMWIERRVEGNRAARMKLDKEPATPRKLRLKVAKHGLWIAVALITGFTFVGYFTPIRPLAVDLARLSLGPWETFWILFYGFATYANAGWMREQVCKHMCPYARLQGVMFDADTLVIGYDRQRGEPRGARPKALDYKAAGLGDCIDCGICVHVCPTGIDIRNGLQYECIGCGACIDGCDQIMDRMGYPRGLIRYSTEAALKHSPRSVARRVARPRVLAYAAVLLVIATSAVAMLYHRGPLQVDVMHDRVAASEAGDRPLIENVYRLRIVNRDKSARELTIRVSGLQEMTMLSEAQPIRIPGESIRLVPVRVRVAREQLPPGEAGIRFTIEAHVVGEAGGPKPRVIEERAAFIAR
jgi:cytochrome c oxidase accessory protein FixG